MDIDRVHEEVGEVLRHLARRRLTDDEKAATLKAALELFLTVSFVDRTREVFDAGLSKLKG